MPEPEVQSTMRRLILRKDEENYYESDDTGEKQSAGARRLRASARQVALEKVNTQEMNLTDFDKESFNMSLNGEYEPSSSERVRRQVELYEATNGLEGGTQHGKPVIVLTSQGAKSGKIRKIPLMRIEHNGVYAMVASHAGARSLRRGEGRVVEASRRRLFGIPQLPSPCRPRNSAVRYRARRGCSIHK